MRLSIEMARAFMIACTLVVGVHAAMAQCTLLAGPGRIEFQAPADSLALPGPQSIHVLGDAAPFKLAGVVTPTGQPNFTVVSPSSGVSSQTLWVGLDRNVVPYLPSGTYILNMQFASPDQPSCAQIVMILRLARGPAPVVTAVVNGASLTPGISPGAIVSILGKNLGTPPISAKYDSGGLYPTSLGNTTVTVNGATAPLLYVSTERIEVAVPYGVAGQPVVDIVVTHNSIASPAFSVPVMDTAPGIFTADGKGNGQGLVLNAGIGYNVTTVNSVDNPAPIGSAITLFATGAGLWSRSLQDGAIVLSSPSASPRPAAPVTLTIGGQPAQLMYVGPAPYEISGRLQLNAIVPAGIGSGPQPLVLAIGNNSNSQQQVTVAVQ